MTLAPFCRCLFLPPAQLRSLLGGIARDLGIHLAHRPRNFFRDVGNFLFDSRGNAFLGNDIAPGDDLADHLQVRAARATVVLPLARFTTTLWTKNSGQEEKSFRCALSALNNLKGKLIPLRREMREGSQILARSKRKCRDVY